MYVKQREGGWVSSYILTIGRKVWEKGCAWNIIQCLCVCMPESVCMCIEIYSTDTTRT